MKYLTAVLRNKFCVYCSFCVENIFDNLNGCTISKLLSSNEFITNAVPLSENT